jgi:hypothetical protein
MLLEEGENADARSCRQNILEVTKTNCKANVFYTKGADSEN